MEGEGDNPLVHLFEPWNETSTQEPEQNIAQTTQDLQYHGEHVTEKYVLHDTVVGSFVTNSPGENIKNATRVRVIEYDPPTIWERFHRSIHDSFRHSFTAELMLLAAIGFLSGVTSFLMEISIIYIYYLHIYLTKISYFWILQLLVWSAFLFILFHVAYLIVKRVSPNSIGSGLPEMKSILNGVNLVEYLSLRTLFAKVTGLICVIGGGIVVGREGPFVHIASAIANVCLSFPLFQYIKQSDSLRLQILTSAIAAGMASNFGAPIGGLLFSIEVTSTYYTVSHYFMSAWTACFSGLTFRILWNIVFDRTHIFGGITETDFPAIVSNSDSLVLIVLALLMALLGTIVGIGFISVTITIIQIRRRYALRWKYVDNAYAYSLVVVTVTSIVLFPELTGYFMTLPLRFALKDLFSVKSLDHAEYGEDWTHVSVYSALLLYGISRFWLTSMSISMPIPCGLFFPCLVSGAALGRFIGECLSNIKGVPLFQEQYFPAIAALLGGAATITVISQTFSPAVIMAELSGQLVLFIPLTVSKYGFEGSKQYSWAQITVVLALAISHRISYNIYDGLLKMKRLPYLPDISAKTSSRAYDIMSTEMLEKEWCVLPSMSYREIAVMLDESPHMIFPVISSYEERRLLGKVSRQKLLRTMELHRQGILQELETDEESNGAASTFSRTIQKVKSLISDQKEEHSLMQPVHGLTSWMDDNLPIPIQHVHIHIEPSTTIYTLHMLSITLRYFGLFVTRNGILVGVIPRQTLRDHIQYSPFFEKIF